MGLVMISNLLYIGGTTKVSPFEMRILKIDVSLAVPSTVSVFTSNADNFILSLA